MQTQSIDIPLLLNFQTCLIHYINYEFLDISPQKNSVIITRYNFGDDDISAMEYCYTDFFAIQTRICLEWKMYNETTYLFEKLNIVTKTKWNCLAQFYLYPSGKNFEPRTSIDMLDMLQYFDFGVRVAQNHSLQYALETRGTDDDEDKITVTSRIAFRFLVTLESSSLNDRMLWSTVMDIGVRKYVSTYLFHIVTRLNSSEGVMVSVGCLVCGCSSNSFEEINTSVMSFDYIAKLYINNFFHRNSIPISFTSVTYEDEIPSSHYITVSQTWPVSEIHENELSEMLLELAFPNYTKTSENFPACSYGSAPCYKGLERKCIGSALTFLSKDDFRYNLRITLKQRDVTYLSCFDRQHEGISFKGFLSAFDTYTWLCVLTVSLFAVGFLLIGAHVFSCANSPAPIKIHPISDVPLALLGILLEQGQNYVSWKQQKKWIAFGVIIPVIFGDLIISNAYKGENINQIIAPFSEAKYDTLDAIISHKFKSYSSSTTRSSITLSDTSRLLSGSNFTLLDEILHQAQKNGIETKLASKLKYLSNGQVRLAKQWIHCYMPYYKNIIQTGDYLKLKCVWDGDVLHNIGKCDKVVYFEDEEFIKLYLLPALKYTGKNSARYSVGQEKVRHASIGTIFYNVRFPEIEKRLHLVQSNGLHDKLYSSFDERRKKTLYSCHHRGYNVFRSEVRTSFELIDFYKPFLYGAKPPGPSAVTIQGNVISLFVAISTLLLVALLVVTFEIILHYINQKGVVEILDAGWYQFCLAVFYVNHAKFQILSAKNFESVTLRTKIRDALKKIFCQNKFNHIMNYVLTRVDELVKKGCNSSN